MAKKPMKTPGAPGASMKPRKSPLAPVLGQVQGTGMQVDDASAQDVYAAGLRPKHGGVGGSDAALGMKGTRGRTATNASAQFRITAKRTPYSQPTYAPTLAAGPILPSVMGSRQNFYASGRYGAMG